MNLEDDHELLNYLSAHSETDLALTHKDHLRRLFDLAGEPVPAHLYSRQFWHAYADVVKPLVRRARARLMECRIDSYQSCVCMRGTKCCTVIHPDSKPDPLASAR